MARQTTLTIEGDDFHINGKPTYEGREWNGHRIEGLLLNSRMVQGIFDDLNPATRSWWDYPDGPWDPDRNTNEFVAAMPSWRAHGLLAFDINLQGGSPRGYSPDQPWHNSAFEADGTLRPDYMDRLSRILDKADDLGMAVMVGLFYFGQDERLADEAAVCAAVDHAVDWLGEADYTNLIIEVNNECNVPKYEHEILTPPRVHELIERVQQRCGGRWPVGTSYGGGAVPKPNVVSVSDVLMVHGNGVGGKAGDNCDPARIREMVDQTRDVDGYRGQPIAFNEDDHFGFDQPNNNFLAAVSKHASWGFFDWRIRKEGEEVSSEPFEYGYQSVPVDWAINSPRKRGFFNLVKDITGA